MSEKTEQLRQQAEGGTFCIVPYCHPDFAWTHHREWHEERYAVSLCEALDLMAAHPEFRFCVEPWIDQIEPFLERCPDRIEELREGLNSGQMGVKAFTLTSPRPATCPDETFLRNMILGRRRYREFASKAELSVMACPDVGLGHSQMPQIVKLAGGRMYRGWRSDSAFREKGVPREFLWRGLDGTELLTSRGIYAGLCHEDLLPADFAERWDEVTERLYEGEMALAMSCSSARTWWVAHGMDDSRPLRGWPWDAPLPLLEFAREWSRREGSQMVFATPAEYAERLAAGELPVWEGVIDPVDVAYNSGWHGARGLWRLRQELDAAMVLAERACALARLAGIDEAAGPTELEAGWVESVRIASHALQWVFERDWEWINTGTRAALRQARERSHVAISRLAGVGRDSGALRPLVLFNPLPYPREEIIEIPWTQPRQDRPGLRLLDSHGKEVELQLGEQAGEAWGGKLVEPSLIFRAEVPPMSCAVYGAKDGAAAAASDAPAGDEVRNGRLCLRLGPRGLQEIADNETGLSWSAPRGSCIGDARLFEMGPGILGVGPITGELSAERGEGRWITTGPLRWSYRWEGAFHGHRVRQDVIIDQGAAHVDFLTRVYCAGANGFFALCFELPVEGELHADIPFGVEPRDLAGEPYGMDMPLSTDNIERHREDQFWARSFASVSEGDRGVSVITIDGDKYWTYDAPTGQLRHILFTPLHDVAEGWEGWITKDRLALGWHEFRHRLVIHAGDWRAADICGESDRARLPLEVVKPVGPAPEELASPIGELRIEPTTVRLSAFYEAEGGYVLRVYESSGDATEAAITLPTAFSHAERVDLNLEPVDAPVELNEAELRMPLRAWEIGTVLLRP